MGLRPTRRGVTLLALAAAYYAAGRFGLSLALIHKSATAIWPPSGIAIAACLLLGADVWPGVFAGAFLVNLTISGAVLPSILIAVGNTSEALAANYLVRRFATGVATFERTLSILIYVVCVGAASAVAATVGSMAGKSAAV